jgi:hypothetical protein
MQVHLSGRYLIAFAALTLLCGLAHELAHHAVGAALCGAFGVKTFNSFALSPACANPRLAFVASTSAGPLVTYGLMWRGRHQLLGADPSTRQRGFALIFANFAIQRIVFALLHANDEQWVTYHLFGRDALAFWLTNAAIWVLAIPPFVTAWRALAGPRKPMTFLAFLVLPFVFVFVFAGLFLEDWVLLGHHVLADRVLGVPILLILTEVLCAWMYLRFRGAIALAGEPGRCR